ADPARLEFVRALWKDLTRLLHDVQALLRQACTTRRRPGVTVDGGASRAGLAATVRTCRIVSRGGTRRRCAGSGWRALRVREYRLIDADSHTLEPPHIWTTWLAKRFHDRAPKLVKDADGGDAW